MRLGLGIIVTVLLTVDITAAALTERLSTNDLVASFKWYLSSQPPIEEFRATRRQPPNPALTKLPELKKTVKVVSTEFVGSKQSDLFVVRTINNGAAAKVQSDFFAGRDSSNSYTIRGKTLTLISETDTNNYAQREFVRSMQAITTDILMFGLGSVTDLQWKENQFTAIRSGNPVEGTLVISNSAPRQVELRSLGQKTPFLTIDYEYAENSPLPTRFTQKKIHTGNEPSLFSEVAFSSLTIADDLPVDLFSHRHYLSKTNYYTNVYQAGALYQVHGSNIVKLRQSAQTPGYHGPPRGVFQNQYRWIIIAFAALIPISFLLVQKMKKDDGTKRRQEII